MNKLNLLKLISINFLVLFILLLIIEILFGGWFFTKNIFNNLNILRNAEINYNVEELYDNKSKTIKYTRDNFGLRGTSTFNHPEKIDILTLGGSTTDQRYLEDGKTWQDILEFNLRSHNINMTVSNAGIDGQSTYGHIKNFQIWFPIIPNLKPKYILFYIGINDFYREALNFTDSYDKFDSVGLHLKIQNNSALYNLYRKMKGIITSRNNKIGHEKIKFAKYKYIHAGILNQEQYTHYFGSKLEKFKSRLFMLINLTGKLGAIPVFITQPTFNYKFLNSGELVGIDEIQTVESNKLNGVDFYNLLNVINNEIYSVATDKSVLVIELTNLKIWEEKDFYNFLHMTPVGAEKVGKIIAENLISIINKNK